MSYTFNPEWPKVSTIPEDIPAFADAPVRGLDLEWDLKDGAITTIGIGDDKWSVTTSYTKGLPFLKALLEQYPEALWCGHNLAGADVYKLHKEGIEIPLDKVEDTILRHWLLNMHLCKTVRKEADADDKEERKGRGFMNLWTLSSIYTNLRNWKYCRDGVQPGKWKPAVLCEGPCPVHQPDLYNAVDVVAPVQALPRMKKIMQLRGLEKLYPMHVKLSYVLAKIQDRGVFTDVPYTNDMRAEFDKEKSALAAEFPFNPNSADQVLKYFHSKGIHLENNQEETIRDAVDHLNAEDGGSPELEALASLLEYKELGDGVDRWFAPMVWNEKGHYYDGFVDSFGYLHPSLGFFTSSARLMCVGPNLQNVAKRRVSRRTCVCGHSKASHIPTCDCGCDKFKGEAEGKKVRRAIIAPPGMIIVRADYSNAENRNFLSLAGYPPPEGDLHNWMVKNIGLLETDEFSIKMGSARDASKSVTHAADYGEGLQLKHPRELKSGKCKEEIECGARLAFPDWTFRNRVVTFTGVNLANRAYGQASYENRRRCLEVVERYIGDGRAIQPLSGKWPLGPFPKIRDLQRKIFKQCEKERVVSPPHGYSLMSFGHDEDRMKQAAAVWGQQAVAHFTKLALLRIDNLETQAKVPLSARLQVHDEILAYWPEDRDPRDGCKYLVDMMVFQTPEMPGFEIPAEASYGPNWRDQQKVKL